MNQILMNNLLLCFLICTIASCKVRSNESDITALVGQKMTEEQISQDSIRVLCMAENGSLMNCIKLHEQGINYTLIYDSDQRVKYILTSDTNFIYGATIRVGTTLRTLREQTGEFSKQRFVLGWGHYVTLGNGWKAVFEAKRELDDEDRIQFFQYP